MKIWISAITDKTTTKDSNTLVAARLFQADRGRFSVSAIQNVRRRFHPSSRLRNTIRFGILCFLGWIIGIGQTHIEWPLVSVALASDNQSLLENRPSNLIRVNSHFVTVPVSVTDNDAKAIRGLKIHEFRITEDGKPETVARIAEASEFPLQLALLFDLSGSLNSRFEFEQQAASRFIRKVWKDGDAACIVAFSHEPHIHLKRSIFISEVLEELLILRPTENPTAFFDSVILSTRILRQSATQETRQAVVVLSDGADNRSEYNLDDTVRELHLSDSVLYAINPSGASVRLNKLNFEGQKNLNLLASATGGTAYVSDTTGDLDKIFDRIASELRAQYLLGYYSSNPSLDGKFRKIEVSIPDKPDLHIRARQGYYSKPR